MKREEKLWTMRGAELIKEAEKVGVKCSHKGNSLKESKEKVIRRILDKEAEVMQELTEAAEKVANTESTLSVPMPVEYDENGPHLIEAEEETEEKTEEAEETEEEAEEKTEEKKKRQKKELSDDVSKLLSYVLTEWENRGGVIKTPETGNFKFNALCNALNGRQLIKLIWTAKKIALVVRIEDALKFAEDGKKINYTMPYQCNFFTYTEANKQNIKNIFDLVFDKDAIKRKKEKNK